MERPAAATPTTAGMRRMLYAASGLVLAAGIPLSLLTTQTDRYFAWTIQSALTAAFLGAGYWASCILELMAARERAWANSRIAVPAVMVFTGLTLLVTLIHSDRFHFGPEHSLFTRLGTWAWLAVYAIVPLLLGVLAFRQRRVAGADPPRRYPLPGWIRGILAITATPLILLGIAMLLAPAAIIPAWPWTLTALTGRAIGAWLIGLGIAAGHQAWENDVLRGRPALCSSVAFSILQLIALARYGGEANWGSPVMGLFLLLLLSPLVVGAGSLAAMRRQSRP